MWISLLKYELTLAQVFKVFYQHKFKTINILQRFLMGDNTISARNLHRNLAQVAYGNHRRYFNYFCCHFDILFGM